MSRGTGEPGDHFVDRHQATELQQQAFAFNWPAHAFGFEAHVIEAIRFATLKPRKREAAEQMRWAYYQSNKAQLPASIRDYQEAILALLMEGCEPADAFAMALRQ